MTQRIPAELVQSAITGTPGAIDQLFERVWIDAYRLAAAILAQRQCAEDAAQEACVIMYRGISSLRDAGAFQTWFYRIVVRESLRQKPDPALLIGLDEHFGFEDHAASIDLWRALDKLPGNLRTVVVLRYFEGLTSPEIGRVLHVPGATVRFRLMIAKRKMRPLLKEIVPFDETKAEIYAR
jgi:RNA polymerase sigma-70 factor, ECF subfamily